MKLYLIFGFIAVGAIASADDDSFSRYQSIVDRQMFGRPPVGFDPTKPPSEVSKKEQKELTKEQEQIKSSVHFSVINITPDGSTAVGFTDSSDAKNPRHYYLKVGESRDGWTVSEADAARAWMKIVKNDIEVELTLGGNSAKGAGTTSRAGEPMTLEARPSAPAGLRSGLLGSGSLRSRRRSRELLRAEEQARLEEEKAKVAAERDAVREELQQIRDHLKAKENADQAAQGNIGNKEANNAENNSEPVQE